MAPLRRAGLVLLALALVFSTFGAAGAETGGETIDGLRDLRRDYDEAVANEAQLLADIADTNAQIDELNTQLGEYDGAIELVRGFLETAREKLAEAEKNRVDAEARLAAINRRLQEERDQLEDKAITAFMRGGNGRALEEVVLGSASSTELAVSAEYTEIVIEDQIAAVDRVVALEAEAEGIRDELTALAEEAQRTRDDIASYEADLTEQRMAVEGQRAEKAELETRQQHLLDIVAGARQDYERRLTALERDSDGVAEVIKQYQAGQTTVDGAIVLGPPLLGLKLGSGFGSRIHPIFGDTRQHNGVDMGAPMGQPIHAAADGTVIVAQERGGYGNVLAIDHGDGMSTLYAHQSRFLVNIGDEVSQGDVIGLVGSTGYSTGPHLHFELRLFGNPLDPVPYLDPDGKLPCRVVHDTYGAAEAEKRQDCVRPR